jgi:succinate dehydrogenase / fumarate reductase cytochrome b subunit
VWLFAAKWGLTVGDKARKRFGYLCLGLAVALIAMGLITIRAFISAPLVPGPSPSSTFESTSLH